MSGFISIRLTGGPSALWCENKRAKAVSAGRPAGFEGHDHVGKEHT